MSRLLMSDKLRQMAGNIDTDNCVEWPHNRGGSGHPKVTLKGQACSGSRLVCEWFHGPPPSPKHDAAHSCGNPPCINPRHIRWATRTENHADRLRHGTDARGEHNSQARLSDLQVTEIRSQHARGLRQCDLARQYGVDPSHISRLIRHEHRPHPTPTDRKEIANG